jgi:hypothetical protein
MKNKLYIEPVESEKKYQRLLKMGADLGLPIPHAYLEIQVLDSKGKSIEHFKQRSHSWNRNYYNFLFCQMASHSAPDNTFGAGKLNIKDNTGTVYFSVVGGSYYIAYFTTKVESGGQDGFHGIAGAVNQGIVVGSGVNAESFEDYILQTVIANGSGAGQLAYVASEAPVLTYDAGTKTLTNTLVRYMNNNSAGDVSVNEVGIMAQGNVGDGATTHIKNYLVCRDHLGATVTIPASGQLKVTYTISVVYPA